MSAYGQVSGLRSDSALRQGIWPPCPTVMLLSRLEPIGFLVLSPALSVLREDPSKGLMFL